MSKTPYLTAPLKTDKMPPGVPYIVGNEAAERFSYYGVNSILVIFMTHFLRNAQGQSDLMTETEANGWYHTFVSAVYFLPLLGAFLADAILGKYRTVFWLSIVYCFGHFALSLNDTRMGLFIGLGLIALGAGGIKPCVSANVGDQFGASNQHLLQRVFTWFYFSINIGSAFSTILIPFLLHDKNFGPKWAFGVPGIAMLLATIVFFIGRKKFVHIPPAGIRPFFAQFRQRENLKAIFNLLIPVPFIAMFWALWQQNFSSWVKQAEKLDRHMFGREWLPEQIQTVNPAFVLVMLPLFSYVIYPLIGKVWRLTPLRKIGIGLFTNALAFALVALVQKRLDGGEQPHVISQILAFLVLTAGEVMVSVTHLEFAYTQAPKKLKSLVMCTYLGAIALGNVFTARVNFYLESTGRTEITASYFWFFVKVMLVTAVLWLVVSPFYRGKDYIQDEAETQPT
jgi:proton-dependent oligopeptide transporter, POT family